MSKYSNDIYIYCFHRCFVPFGWLLGELFFQSLVRCEKSHKDNEFNQFN